MNEMRKIMESILLETPLRVGDIVGYKNKSYEVAGINPNDFNQVFIKSQTSDAEGWVDDSKLSRNPPVAETSELEEGKAEYTKKLMKSKSIVDYVKKQQEKNRKEVAMSGNYNDDRFGNEPRFDTGTHWTGMASAQVEQNKMSDEKRRSFDSEAEYEAIARKLGLDRFEPRLEQVESDDIDTFLENLEISVRNIISK